MNGAEHHDAADRLLLEARTVQDGLRRSQILAEAQVHATLALSAAPATRPRSEEKLLVVDPYIPPPSEETLPPGQPTGPPPDLPTESIFEQDDPGEQKPGGPEKPEPAGGFRPV